MAIRLGLQISNFSYDGGPAALFSTVAAQAREAEAAGFDSVFLMDHLYQLPTAGDPYQPMMESYTTLGALAAATSRIQLGTLVTGITYRNPALLAKQITTLDVISGGRAILGLGTGWFELEHRQLGFDYGTFTQRFERLDEALQIIVPMIEGRRPTFSGHWYRVENAVAEPRLRPRIPLLIGGSGENKTFPLAARHFDHLNIIAPLAQLPTKLSVLQRRCIDVGRDPATLETSVLVVALGVDTDPESLPPEVRAQSAIGTPSAIAAHIADKVVAAGVDGVILNVPHYTPGRVAELGEAILPLVQP